MELALMPVGVISAKTQKDPKEEHIDWRNAFVNNNPFSQLHPIPPYF